MTLEERCTQTLGVWAMQALAAQTRIEALEGIVSEQGVKLAEKDERIESLEAEVTLYNTYKPAELLPADTEFVDDVAPPYDEDAVSI